MKSCPTCGKQYPASEIFCEADGTTLVESTEAPIGKPTTLMPGEGATPDHPLLECPVCGGKAQPGEVICNFCGARLGTEQSDQWRTGSTGQRGAQSGHLTTSPGGAGPQEFGEGGVSGAELPESRRGRRMLRFVGFSVAAVAAL